MELKEKPGGFRAGLITALSGEVRTGLDSVVMIHSCRERETSQAVQTNSPGVSVSCFSPVARFHHWDAGFLTKGNMIQETPWGVAQHHKRIADGIDWFSTASHGGLRVSISRLLQMPENLRSIKTWAGVGWYEEDCDWAVVVVAFPDCFDAGTVATAKASFNGMLDYFRNQGFQGLPV